MHLRTTLLTLLALAVSAALVFHLFQRQLSRTWFAFGVHPDVLAAVERSLEDQKQLARFDPAREPHYRRRFESARTLLARLRVVELSRQEIVWRYEAALLIAVAGIAVLSGSGYALRQARQAGRLARLQAALGDLAAGRTDVRVGERRRDLIGRIAAMIERTSRVMARDRRRLASLENLSSWQEAARRQAHEMRGPLTAARLELTRMRSLVEGPAEGRTPEELARLHESLGQELDRLSAFTQRFTSFARLPPPCLERHDLGRLAGDFADLFAAAWPELTVRLTPPARPFEARVDPEMLRQALVNLGDNSAQALRDQGRTDGTLTLSLAETDEGIALDVADDGPGVPDALRGRLFEPYATSRRIGEGMGLGLAIARKVLLDQGGDLELLHTSEAGTTFRLLFPRPASPETPETPE